jgi:hypothetical protein
MRISPSRHPERLLALDLVRTDPEATACGGRNVSTG